MAKRGLANLLIDAGKVLSMRPYKTASKRSSLVNMGTSDGQARVDGSAKFKTATGTSWSWRDETTGGDDLISATGKIKWNVNDDDDDFNGNDDHERGEGRV